MADYQKMYFTLFHATTDAINRLQEAQQKAEELYIQSGETPLTTLRAEQEAAATVSDTPDTHMPGAKEQPAHKPPDCPRHDRLAGKSHHKNDPCR